MEENVKLARIKKSCKVGQTVSTVLLVIVIVCFALALIGGSVVLNMGERFEALAQQAVASGDFTAEVRIGGFKIMDFDVTDLGAVHSDVPALNEAIMSHPYTSSAALYLFTMVGMCLVFAVLLYLIRSVFALIRTESTPFTDKVIRRVVIAMAVTSGVLLFTVSGGLAAIGGILTWAVYAIMDYGKTLQHQYDETL